MGWIKDIYDVNKDRVDNVKARRKIKRILLADAQLNHKFLSDLLKPGKPLSEARLNEIAQNLKYDKLEGAVEYDGSFSRISRRKVTQKLLDQINIKASRLIGNNLEQMINSLYIKMVYVAKDYNNNEINLKARLRNIAKENLVLIQLLK